MHLMKENEKVNDKSWDYYLPCGYTRCESDVLAFQNENTGKKLFMIDGCDWIASKVGLWELIKREFGTNAHFIMPETLFFLMNQIKLSLKIFTLKEKFK